MGSGLRLLGVEGALPRLVDQAQRDQFRGGLEVGELGVQEDQHGMAMSLGCPKQILHAHGIEADRTQMLGGHETGKPGTTTNGGLSLGSKRTWTPILSQRSKR